MVALTGLKSLILIFHYLMHVLHSMSLKQQVIVYTCYLVLRMGAARLVGFIYQPIQELLLKGKVIPRILLSLVVMVLGETISQIMILQLAYHMHQRQG